MSRNHPGLMRRAIVTALAVSAIYTPGAMAIPATASVSCGRFIIGRADSSAYPNFQLPARGSAYAASCATLRRIARRL